MSKKINLINTSFFLKSNKTRIIISFISIFSLTILLNSCAAIKAPSGGPKDTTPPELIGSDPPQGTTGWEGGKIRLFFSEYMSDSGLDKAFSISPALTEDWSVELKGDIVIIEIPPSLERNRTYVITMNRTLKDEHGVPIEKGSQIAFSTGNIIDNGEISGTLYDAEKLSVHLWIWDEAVHRDSVYFSIPDYVTDAGDDGTFSFRYLAPGLYRILSVGSESTGKPFGSRVLRVGIPSQESLKLEKGKTIRHNMMRIQRLKPPLKLTRADIMDSFWGKIFFNESVKELPLENLVSLIQEDSVIYFPKLFPDPNAQNVIMFLTDSLKPNVKTRVQSKLVSDENNMIILDSLNINAKVPEKADTTNLIIKNPGKRITIHPDINNGPPVDIVLSRPLKNYQSLFQFHLVNSDTDSVALKIEWKSPINLTILPINGWMENQSYSLMITSLDTLPYRSLEDSVYNIKINSKDRVGYGKLIGSVTDSLHQHLSVEAISIENPKNRYSAVVNSASNFEIDTLPSGKYTLLFFDDTDENQSFSFGEVVPFNSAEWFYIYPDTVDIRANWDYEIKQIKMGWD